MVCKVRGSNDFCGDGVAVCDVMARAVWRAKSMTATTYMDNGATACNGMAGAVTISVAMVEFLALFAQEPTHVPRAHGLSEICEQQWYGFANLFSKNLLTNAKSDRCLCYFSDFADRSRIVSRIFIFLP